MLGIILTLISVGVVYYYFNSNKHYFDERGVKCVKSFGGLGIVYNAFFGKQHFNEFFKNIYNAFPERRFVGFFEITRPLYMIRDVELIKQIAVKNFDSFLNHRFVIDENVDKLFGRSLIMLNDQKWKDMRATLSPAFTGSKMRLMFKLLMEVSDENMKYFKEQAQNNLGLDVELYDLLTRYSNDVIAKCVFGATMNSYKDKNNEFYETGRSFVKFGKKSLFKLFLYSAFPWLMQKLKVKLLDDKCTQLFKDLIFGSIEYREKNNVKIHDMIDIFMQVRKNGQIKVEDDAKDENAGFATVQESEVLKKTANKITKFDDDDIIGQTIIFFIGGFDTISTSLCFMCYQLALYPDCQDKLISEIDDVTQELDGNLPTYETIQKMEYLDMVVSESLRLYNPMIIIDRKCNKRSVIEDSDGNPVVLNPGDAVIIPVDAIHRDAKHFPDPNKFDPERFSSENRRKIKPYTYIPFGVGPRNCIGSRLALMECKAILFSLLSNFRIEKNHLTVDPIQLDSSDFSLRIKGGFNVRFQLRNKTKEK